MAARVGIKEIEDIAFGAIVLSTGGRDNSYIGKLIAKRAIGGFGPVELLPPDELDTGDSVIPTARMGAPTVSAEKLPSERGAVASMERIKRKLEKTTDAMMSIECGDINSTFPFTAAARRGLPVVDADGTGRAFPELQHEAFNIYSVSGTLAVVGDKQRSTCLIETEDNDQLGWLTRDVIVRIGGIAYVSDYPMIGTQTSETAIPDAVSLVRNLDRAFRFAEGDAISAIREVTCESIYDETWSLSEGKIVSVQCRAERGSVSSYVDIGDLDGDEGLTMRIESQNENLGAAVSESYVTVAPGPITVLNRETGDPIPTESLRCRAQTHVLGTRTPEIVWAPAVFDVWGPALFGLDATYEPLVGHP